MFEWPTLVTVTNRPLQPLTEPHRSKTVRMAKDNIHAVFFDVEKVGSNPPPRNQPFQSLTSIGQNREGTDFRSPVL